MAHVGTEGRWLRVNRKLCEIVGYSREELLGKTFRYITYTDDLDVDLEQVRRLLAGDAESYSTEKRYVRKDHSQVWVKLTVSLGRKLSGEPNYFVFIIEDITEYKQAESMSETLTPREIEVLRLLTQGNTNREIAESMMFSEGTAKINVQHIMTKLGVKNRAQAILRAVEIGLISPSSRRL
jgi:PAS domain S-box-containing protein